MLRDQCGPAPAKVTPRPLPRPARQLLRPHRADRIAPVLAEAARRDADSDRSLAALVFVALDQAHDLRHVLGRVAARHDVGGTQLLLDVSLENSVEHVIWRQAVLVSLVGAQLCRRRAADDALRNDAPEAVAVTREPIDERLADVLQPR